MRATWRTSSVTWRASRSEESSIYVGYPRRRLSPRRDWGDLPIMEPDRGAAASKKPDALAPWPLSILKILDASRTRIFFSF